MTFDGKCPTCGEDISYELTEEEAKAYKDVASGKVKDISKLPIPAHVRELFISGMCYRCQSEIFNVSTPGHDLGKVVGTCPECDCDLHEKNISKGYCPSCGVKLN